ncbi:acetylglutamate kinase [Thermodesulfobacteriota bacterium]
MKKYIEKANVLLESLPYIKEFNDKIFVIKFGGNAMQDDSLKKEFARNIVLLKYIGINPVIVHGGGPQIEAHLSRLNKETRFVDGLRVTDSETMEIVEMVLVGKVNKEIVALINSAGGKAVGLSGKDGGLIMADKKTFKDSSGESVDMGMIGEINSINPQIIDTLDADKFIPVIAPVGTDEVGNTYNINADTVASSIASSLSAEKLILLTNVSGVLNGEGELLSTLTRSETEKFISEGTIKDGMIPKVRCCLDALERGVKKTHIIDGTIVHALLIEIFTKMGIGTQIV